MKLQDRISFTKDIITLIQWASNNGVKSILEGIQDQHIAIINLYDFENEPITDSKQIEEFGIYWESLHPLNKWCGKGKNPEVYNFERKEHE